MTNRLDPIAEKTLITEITLSDGTVLMLYSGFDTGDEVSIAMYAAQDLVVHDESDEPAAPVVELWMSAEAAERLGEAITLGAALAYTARRPKLTLVSQGAE